MTTLKDPLSEGDAGSLEPGVLSELAAGSGVPADPAQAMVDAAIEREADRLTAPELHLPLVFPAHSDACSSLDFVPMVRAEVIVEKPHELEANPVAEVAMAPPNTLPRPVPAVVMPIVMPAHSDSGGLLDFVRVVRADVHFDRPPEPALEPALPHVPAAAPIQPVLAPPRVEMAAPVAPSLPDITAPSVLAALAPAAAATFDARPAPPLSFPAPEPTRVATAVRPMWRRWVRRAVLTLIGLTFGYAALVLLLIVGYRGFDPPLSTLMLELKLRGEEVDYRPVPLTSISSYLQRAVVTSEDARFCSHHGVDWGALAEAIQDSRGGSTITMQTAKNLFLWPSRSYIRKAIEIPIALTIDFAWPKRRILEIYLNIAEWGPGIFGAEAAAQYHFSKSASRLTPQEATLLAAVLPNPIARDAGDPGRVTELLASRLRGRLANSDSYVRCLALRPAPRTEPATRSKPSTTTAPKAVPQPSANWQTKTEPAKPSQPAFNPWQN